jgi:glycosyltransferase involved in cell wall biosynthesis
MSMVKLAILISPDPNYSGGAFTYSKLLMNGIAASIDKQVFDFDFIFIQGNKILNLFEYKTQPSISKKSRYTEIFNYVGNKLIFVRIPYALRKLNRDLKRILLNRKMRKLKVDFVWSLYPLAFPLDLPYATTIWDLQHRLQPFWPEFGQSAHWQSRENAFKNSIQRATFVITGNKVGAEEISNFYSIPEQRIILCPFPVTPQHKLSNSRKPNQIFYPAQFWPHKNHINLLKGLRLAIDKSGINFKLILPGSDKGNMKYVLFQTDLLGLSKNVVFPGFIQLDELEKLYNESFLMIFPSYFGPDNLPPLEGIAHNCPVATARVPGAFEQLGYTVRYFDPDSPYEICDAILHASLNPRLSQRELNSRKKLLKLQTPIMSASIVLSEISKFGSKNIIQRFPKS